MMQHISFTEPDTGSSSRTGPASPPRRPARPRLIVTPPSWRDPRHAPQHPSTSPVVSSTRGCRLGRSPSGRPRLPPTVGGFGAPAPPRTRGVRADSSGRTPPAVAPRLHRRTTAPPTNHPPIRDPLGPASPPTEGNIVNTSTLTAGSTHQSQATALSAQARGLQQRLALRTGLALLAWSRRQDERRTPEAVHLRRQTAQLATRARDDQHRLSHSQPRWCDHHGYRHHRAPAAPTPPRWGTGPRRPRLCTAASRAHRPTGSLRCRRRRACAGRRRSRRLDPHGASGGTPSAGSASFRRSAISSRLTRLSCGTSASGNHLASSLEPPTSLRSSPPTHARRGRPRASRRAEVPVCRFAAGTTMVSMPSRRSTDASYPVSSKISRRAAAAGCSAPSMPPPGRVQPERPYSFQWDSRISPRG